MEIIDNIRIKKLEAELRNALRKIDAQEKWIKALKERITAIELALETRRR